MTCSGRLFHSLIILDVKNMFLLVVVCLGLCNLRLCPLVSCLASPSVQFEEAFLAPHPVNTLENLEGLDHISCSACCLQGDESQAG